MVRLLTIATVAASLAASAAGSVQKPTLTIERSSPLVVRGLAFHARETVTVTAPVGQLKVRASANGSFLANFQHTGDRCTGGRIIALGATGDRVVMKLPPAMCLPAATQANPG